MIIFLLSLILVKSVPDSKYNVNFVTKIIQCQKGAAWKDDDMQERHSFINYFYCQNITYSKKWYKINNTSTTTWVKVFRFLIHDWILQIVWPQRWLPGNNTEARWGQERPLQPGARLGTDTTCTFRRMVDGGWRVLLDSCNLMSEENNSKRWNFIDMWWHSWSKGNVIYNFNCHWLMDWDKDEILKFTPIASLHS